MSGAEQDPDPQASGSGLWSWIAAAWSRLLARLPLGMALSAVTAVWAFGAVWSFTEQSAFAQAKGFSDPALLPLVLDGLAVAMAGVAFAASLDARPAVGARLGTALAVLASAGSNGLWAAQRSSAAGAGANPALHSPDWTTVAIGAGIPIAANIAFEVLLGELRRQVQRRRGLPAPVALPSLRLLRLLLAPRSTFREWRNEVLVLTAPKPSPSQPTVTEDATTSEADNWAATSPPLQAGEAEVVDERAALEAAEPSNADPLISLDAGPVTQPALPPAQPAGDAPENNTDATDLATEVGPAGATEHGRDDARELVGDQEAHSGQDSVTEAGVPEDAEELGEPGMAFGEDGTARGDGRVRLLGELLDAGAAVTGAQAAMLLSHTHGPTSGRTGRRLLAEARQTPLPADSTDPDERPASPDPSARTGTEDAARPGAALSLVTRRSTPPSAGELP